MGILDVLTGMMLPRQCEICGRDLLAGEHTLCVHCVAALPVCREPEADLRASRITRGAAVGRVYPWLSYTHDNDVARIVRLGKYNNRPDIFARLGDMLGRHLVAIGCLDGVDALIPVPMHWFKRMRRGYNQAELIAMAISARTGIPVLRGALKAVRAHHRQAGSGREERAANVRGSFRATRDLRGMHVAVVDDILTTGATVSAAVDALAERCPRLISVFTLAAAPAQ